MESLDIPPASGESGLTPLTTQLTAHFNIIPISLGEELLSVQGLVSFRMMLSGRGTVGFYPNPPILDIVSTLPLDAAV